MRHIFDPQSGLIVVRAEVAGTAGIVLVRLALDTGATGTLLNVAVLVSIGYDPALVPDRVQITTGSGVEFVPRVSVNRFTTLGSSRADFPVLAHTLPTSAGIDGLLGLDFLRETRLLIDFQAGSIRLT